MNFFKNWRSFKKRGRAYHVIVNAEEMDFMELFVSEYLMINLNETKLLLIENTHISLCESTISFKCNKLVFTTKNGQ